MLLPEQEEFFRCFGIAAPPGMSADGARRFMDAYLKDPARLARWQAHRADRPAAPAAPIPPAAPPAPPVIARPVAAAAAPGTEQRVDLQFTGSGGEYFGIWIVNLLLTMVTFGIYSAWAKVARLQYFYRHTDLAGASFDYHGTPLSILKGRLIALGLFILYNVSFDLSVALGVVTMIGLAVALPWLLRSSFRFRMRNSSYRGLRFRFVGTLREAYWTFLLRPLVSVFTLHAALPWAHQRLKRYQHGEAQYGRAPFTFSASVGQFYRVYLLIAIVALLALALPAGMMFGAVSDMAQAAQAARDTGAQPPDPAAFVGTMVTAILLFFAGMLVLAPLFQARIQNLVWNHTTLGPHRFESRLSALSLFWIHLSNMLLILLTLGFYTPWAAVRVARYRCSTITMIVAGDLDSFVAGQQAEVDATGEETAEMFDIDIAL